MKRFFGLAHRELPDIVIDTSDPTLIVLIAVLSVATVVCLLAIWVLA